MVYLLNDFEATLPIFSTICNGCKHWIRKPGRKCLAFPDGIPLAIWLGENDHRAAFPGDHGIQFMPKPVVAATPKPTKVRKKRVVVKGYPRRCRGFVRAFGKIRRYSSR